MDTDNLKGAYPCLNCDATYKYPRQTCIECGGQIWCDDLEDDDEDEYEESSRCSCPFCFCVSHTEYGEICNNCLAGSHQG